MRVITAGDGIRSQYSRVAHFGLANSDHVAELIVEWPSGKRQRFLNVEANQLIDVDEYQNRLEGARVATNP